MKAQILNVSATLLVLLIGLSSCQDSISEKEQFKKGGEDTDEPILAGRAIDEYEAPIYPGALELYQPGSSEPIDNSSTDQHGDFQFTLSQTGEYYIKAYQNNELQGISDTVAVQDSTYMTLRL